MKKDVVLISYFCCNYHLFCILLELASENYEVKISNSLTRVPRNPTLWKVDDSWSYSKRRFDFKNCKDDFTLPSSTKMEIHREMPNFDPILLRHQRTKTEWRKSIEPMCKVVNNDDDIWLWLWCRHFKVKIALIYLLEWPSFLGDQGWRWKIDLVLFPNHFFSILISRLSFPLHFFVTLVISFLTPINICHGWA